MKIAARLLYLLSIVFWMACRQSPDKSNWEPPKDVEYTIVSRSPLFNKDRTSFSLQTHMNKLLVILNLSEMRQLPFPIVKMTGDTLFETAFHFDFYYNGKIIKTDLRKNQRTLRWAVDSSLTANDLSFVSDTIALNTANQLIYEIPLSAFHSLKRGKQTIELHMWQNTFKGEHRVKKAGSTETISDYATRSLFDAKIKFDLLIPAIYKSEVYGFGLQLRNDSTFSPAGMDNTLWNSSYPDIYWTLYYPVNEFYAQTDYQRSTDAYHGSDTFELYHYYENDSLGIGVYDHDDLSRDDGLGFWSGSMDYLRRAPRRRIAFDNIKWFDIRVGKATVVN